MPLFRRRRAYAGDSLSGRGGGRLLLSPPTFGIFLASLVVAAVALVIRYTSLDVPIVNARYVFEILLIGYALLLAGVLFRRI